MSESNPAPASEPKKKKKSIAKASDATKKETAVVEERRKSSVKPEELSSSSKDPGEGKRKSSVKPEEISALNKSTAEDRRKSSLKQTSQIKTTIEDPKPIPSDSLFKEEKIVRKPSRKEHKKDVLDDLDENKLRDLKEAFEIFDLNHDGIIDFNDLKHTFLTLGRMNVQDSEMNSMLAEATNPLDFDSFVELLGYRTIELDPEEILVEALSQWDYDSSGFISEERIKHDLMTWGDRFTQQEVEYALEDAPTTISPKGVPMINYISFCNILCGLRKKTKSPCPEDFMKNL